MGISENLKNLEGDDRININELSPCLRKIVRNIKEELERGEFDFSNLLDVKVLDGILKDF